MNIGDLGSVAKLGKGIRVICAPKAVKRLGIDQAPAKYVVHLVGDWEVSFGAQEGPTDQELTQYMINITVPWDLAAKAYRTPWHFLISAQQLRSGDLGEILLEALTDYPESKSPREHSSPIPRNAALPRTFIEATRPKEIKAILKFGRDFDWPLKITVASALNEIDSLAITYQASWEDYSSNTTEWLVAKFLAAAKQDGLGPLPVWEREGLTWPFYMGVEQRGSMFPRQRSLGFLPTSSMPRMRNSNLDASLRKF
jgi:hypothetical protein